MIKKIKQELLKYAYYFPDVQSRLDAKRQSETLAEWKKNPHPSMLPHLLKQEVLRKYALDYHLVNLVETGTYLGEMVYALKDIFKNIYSIELSEEYANRARIYLRRQKNVKIFQGDSGDVLAELLQDIDQPTLFWLDGHYSGDNTAKGNTHTPILKELRHILSAKDLNHIILIDDARLFGSTNDYPSLDELSSIVESFRKNLKIISENDIIRITPQ